LAALDLVGLTTDKSASLAGNGWTQTFWNELRHLSEST